MKKIFWFSIVFSFLLLHIVGLNAQPLNKKKGFTHADTLRGSITPERAWWDAIRYDISVVPDFESKSIKGSNIISFKALADGKKMQIDLQTPMEITDVQDGESHPKFERDGNAYFLEFPEIIRKGAVKKINVMIAGTPKEAKRPPWDGGWIWAKDNN